MAELDGILTKIEQASQEKCDAIRAEAERYFVQLDTEAESRRTQEQTRAIDALTRSSDSAYQRGRAALEQESRKVLLQAQRSLLEEVASSLRDRMQNCSKEEFQAFLRCALLELPGDGELHIQFGGDSPLDSWKEWTAEFLSSSLPPISYLVNQQPLPGQVGFVLRRDAVIYRLMADDISAEILDEKGGGLQVLLFGYYADSPEKTA